MKEAASKVKEEENGAKDKREKSTKLKMNLLPNEHSLLENCLSSNATYMIIFNFTILHSLISVKQHFF